jgi:uncharacterized membrane protein
MTTATGDRTKTPAAVGSLRPSGGLMVAILVFAVIGLLDASYLTYEHYNGLAGLLCLGGHHGHSSCETVQSSVYSKVAGVPVALLGLVGYILLLGSLRIPGEQGRFATFAIAVFGFAFSMYLTYRELFSIHAICEWCVGSAVCLTVLMVLTGVRWLRSAPLPA